MAGKIVGHIEFTMSEDERMESATREIKRVCQDSTSGSRFYAYGSSGYKDSIRHFLESSTEVARAAVQPATARDLSDIMRILAKFKVPFGVKSGGHATSPYLSSTTGIQIYLSLMDSITYNEQNKTVTLGTGALFDQVYRELRRYGRNVVGGSATQGVGVGGWYLGGGYSLISNRYGIGIDNIVEMEVVLPSGQIVRAYENSVDYKDLFRALKGGRNNFGIVTKFVIKTVEYCDPWASLYSFPSEYEDGVKTAIANFAGRDINLPREAVLVAAYRYEVDPNLVDPQYRITAFCSYYAPNQVQPPEVFQEFANLDTMFRAGSGRGGPEDESDLGLSTLRQMSYLDADQLFAASYSRGEVLDQISLEWGANGGDADRGGPGPEPPIPTQGMSGIGETPRGRFGCIMITKFTRELVDAIGEEAKSASQNMRQQGGLRVIFDIWPTHPNAFDKSTESAWPHPKDKPCGPMLAYFVWEGAKNDAYWLDLMSKALGRLNNLAIKLGCATKDLPIYSNTALETLQPYEIWRYQLYWLQGVKEKYDPKNIMGLTGDKFKIPLPSD